MWDSVLPFLGGMMDRADQRKAASREMSSKIETGKKFGLHPLAAIGAQTSGYQPVMAQAMTSAGNSIQAARAREDQQREAAKVEGLQRELLESQIAEVRSRTLLNQRNALRPLVGPASEDDPFRRRQENALIEVMLENGQVVTIPNPDVYEISPTELATGRVILEGGRVLENASTDRRTQDGRIRTQRVRGPRDR